MAPTTFHRFFPHRSRSARVASAVAVTSLLAGCSSSSGNHASPATDGGQDVMVADTGGPDVAHGGDAATDAGAGDGGTVYCNGIELKNASGADVYMLLYPLAADVASSCPSLSGTGGAFPAVGAMFARVGGIWDTYPTAPMPPFNAVMPGGCDDVGTGSAPAGGTYTTPDGGAMTVAAAVQAAMAGGGGDAGSDGGSMGTSVYGVVTFVAPWGKDAQGTAYSGSIYIQDPVAMGGTPMPHSGVDIYIASTLVGGASLPTSAPARGDVVLFTNVAWAPYKGLNEFGYGMGSSITKLGTSALPPPVALQASDLASGSTSADQWKGMRVVDKESFTVLDNCPAPLQYTPSGG